MKLPSRPDISSTERSNPWRGVEARNAVIEYSSRAREPARDKFPKMDNIPTSKLAEIGDFQCLGHLNWTKCSPVSFSCARIFPTFWLSYWEPILITPEVQLWERGNLPTSKLDETEGFRRLGHSNWTKCSPLSSSCAKIFHKKKSSMGC